MTVGPYTDREVKEIWLALFYKNVLGGYGTAGHNRLELIAALAIEHGFGLDQSYHLWYKGKPVEFTGQETRQFKEAEDG